MQRCLRVKKELEQLLTSPPHGISCYPVADCLNQLEAKIMGVEGTPYHGGIFKVQVDLPERYPFEPPKVQFLTPIYHPNIDSAGRICMDTLKMPPKGSWRPIINIEQVLKQLQLLMETPNPDDALMVDIATEFKHNPELFRQKATQHTVQHATQAVVQPLSEQSVEADGSGYLHYSQLPGSIHSGKRTAAISLGLNDVTNNKKIKFT